MRQLIIPFAEREIAAGFQTHWSDLAARLAAKPRFRLTSSPIPMTFDLSYEDPIVSTVSVTAQSIAPQAISAKEAVPVFVTSIQWTDQEIKDLHVGILERHLELLNASSFTAHRITSERGIQEKMEICEWIFATRYLGQEQLPDGSVRNRYREEIPFSFEACCKFAGMDADKLRSGIEKMLGPLQIASILNKSRFSDPEGAIQSWH